MNNVQCEDMDAEELKIHYEQQREELTSALLRGMPWEEVKEKQYSITQLSILLYRRISHPAAHGRSRI